MKKFSRKLKRIISKIEKIISREEILRLKKWLFNLCEINYKIIKNREKMNNELLKNGYSKIIDLEK